MSDSDTLKKTPLYDWHLERNARMVDFGGWAMPVQYTSILDEHTVCRNKIALFDTSHMGQFEIRGSGAREALDKIVSRSLAGLKPGQARYGFLCDENGGTIDDTVVYRHPDDTDETHYYMVVNAGTTDGDREHVSALLPKTVSLEDVSAQTVKIDIQGPAARLPLAAICDADLKSLKRFHAIMTAVLGEVCLVSRSGYTGEYGFELYCGVEHGRAVWQALIEHGAPRGLKPAGLGARDTLRTEVCLPLYGHELSRDITPVMAGQQWAISFDKTFLGVDALRKENATGPARRIVPFLLEGRQAARPGDIVTDSSGSELGVVTSGTFCPSLNRAGGMMLIDSESAMPGATVDIRLKRRTVQAGIVDKPLYKKPKK